MPMTLKLKNVSETRLTTVPELRHQVYLLTRRLEHTECELVQARVSRDSWKAKYTKIMQAPKSEEAPESPEGAEA